MKKAALISLTFLLLVAKTSGAGVGTTGAVLMRYNFSPQAEAMGEAWTAKADDLYAMYINPAGLANIQQFELSTTYSKGLIDDYYGQVNTAFLLAPDIAVGVGVVNYNGGAFDDIDYLGKAVKSMIAELDTMVVAAGAWQINEQFSVGISSEYLYSILLGDRVGRTVAFGAGAIYSPRDWFHFGAALRNAGSNISYGGVESDKLPTIGQFGVAVDLLKIAKAVPQQDLVAAFDVQQGYDTPLFYNLGLEYLVRKNYALRAGYKINRDIDWLSLGAGVQLDLIASAPVQLDYSISLAKALNATHKISLTLKMPQPTVQAVVPASPSSADVPAALAASSMKPEMPKAKPQAKSDAPAISGGIEQKEQRNNKYNYIAINPVGFIAMNNFTLGVLKLEYERGLTDKLTGVLQGYLTMGKATGGGVSSGYTKYGPGLGLRYYPGGEIGKQVGWWFGPEGYIQFGKEELKGSNGSQTTILNHDEYSASVCVGYKWVINDWLVISPYAGIGYQIIKNINVSGTKFSDMSSFNSTGGINAGLAF